MGKGQSFLGNIDESRHRHLRIVISDADCYNCFLTVPVVTLRKEQRFCDKSCIIEKGEHPFIIRTSCIDYRHALSLSFAQIFNGIQKGIFIRKEDVSETLLKKIQNGAKTTKFLPNKYKVFFELF